MALLGVSCSSDVVKSTEVELRALEWDACGETAEPATCTGDCSFYWWPKNEVWPAGEPAVHAAAPLGCFGAQSECVDADDCNAAQRCTPFVVTVCEEAGTSASCVRSQSLCWPPLAAAAEQLERQERGR